MGKRTTPRSLADGEIRRAIEAFVRGYSYSKSRTHPYECTQFGTIWLMRDAPRRNPRDYRKEEWITYGDVPEEVDALARSQTRGRFFVCAVAADGESDEPIRDAYKKLNFRLLSTEGFFVHRLKRIPRPKSAAKIERVMSRDLADRLGKATRSRPIPDEQLVKDAPFRQYVATIGERIVGWVRSINAGECTWCADMEVIPAERRRGIGQALMTSMLRDDRAFNFKQSVLLASHTGALLYPRVGYERLGTLLIFAPKKAK